MNFFKNLASVPPDPIFGLMSAFKEDPRENKVNLVAGVYQTSDLKPLILNTVKKTEALILESEKSKDYLPIDGMREYVNATQQLVFGNLDQKIYGAQTVGGTAALRVGGDFLRQQGFSKIYAPSPTWANHQRIFHQAGLEWNTYPYLNIKKGELNFQGILDALEKMEQGSVVLLHACCHNPTGIDPSQEQWKEICRMMKAKDLFPFFDCAYQGFGESLDKDAFSLRCFFDEGLEFAVAVSHSKNFGLYAERCGALYLVCSNTSQAASARSNICGVIRGMYSNPPCHGASIVATILSNAELKQKWQTELGSIRDRISEMRKMLVKQILASNPSRNFDFLLSQRGMFSYTGLAKEHVDRLIAEYGIYLPQDGRINISGLSAENLNYVAEAILTVINQT